MNEIAFRWLLVAAVLGAGMVAYLNSFSGEWVWDDASSVLMHKHVQDPSQFLQLFREDQHAFGRGAGNFYRPLVAASFMVDYGLSYDPQRDAPQGKPYPEVKAFLFHLTNLFWHVAAALLFFALLTRFGAPVFVRAAAPLIFVVHPLQTEAVAYVSGRADMMSAAFMLAGLCFAFWERRRVLGIALAALSFVGALLSKESSMIFPALLAVLGILPALQSEEGAKRGERVLRQAVPLVVAGIILGVYAALRMTVLKFAESTPGPESGFGQRCVETGQAFFFYLRKLFWPTHLHMEQSLEGVPLWHAVAGLGLLAACLGLVVWAWRARHMRVCMGMTWFLVAWIPISGLFPLNAPMAEHWMYVPMLGFWWAVLELLWMAGDRPLWRPAAVGSVVAGCLLFTVFTVERNRDWHDNERLFLATLRENPNTLRVHYNLAVTYEDLLGNLPGARRHYEAVLRLGERQMETAVDAHLSLGRIALRQGLYEEALTHFGSLAGLKGEQYRPQVIAALMGLGKALLALGDLPNANVCLQRVMTLDASQGQEVEALLSGKPIS